MVPDWRLRFGRFRYCTGVPCVCVATPLADVSVIQIPGKSNPLSIESQIEDQSPLEIISVHGKAGDAPKSISQVVQNFRNFICRAHNVLADPLETIAVLLYVILSGTFGVSDTKNKKNIKIKDTDDLL